MELKTYNNCPLSDISPRKAALDIATYGFIILKNTNSSPEEFAKWSLELGYHLSPRIWCTDKIHSHLYWRVTNKFVDDSEKGLVADNHLDWHTNITPVLDGEEIVGLYAKEITYPTETWICNSIPYWNQLSDVWKIYFQELQVILDPYREKGRIQGEWSPEWVNSYSKKVIDGINHNRNTRDISNAENIEIIHKKSFKKSRGILTQARLVPDHPLKSKGLFFSPFEIHGFTKNDNSQVNSEDIYWKIWNEMIASEKYTYKHKWEQGDILLMDQVLTIHKRPQIKREESRELLRIACWYKAEDRKNFNYIL